MITKNLKSSENIKIEFHLKDTHKIYWLQIIDVLPKRWKDIILRGKGNIKKLLIFDHHIVRKCQIYSLNKLTSIPFLLKQMLLNRQHKIISRIFLKHHSLFGKKKFF